VGRSSSFEVVVNGNLIFSKLECQGFPYSKDVIAEIKKIQAGEKVNLSKRVPAKTTVFD